MAEHLDKLEAAVKESVSALEKFEADEVAGPFISGLIGEILKKLDDAIGFYGEICKEPTSVTDQDILDQFQWAITKWPDSLSMLRSAMMTSKGCDKAFEDIDVSASVVTVLSDLLKMTMQDIFLKDTLDALKEDVDDSPENLSALAGELAKPSPEGTLLMDQSGDIDGVGDLFSDADNPPKD